MKKLIALLFLLTASAHAVTLVKDKDVDPAAAIKTAKLAALAANSVVFTGGDGKLVAGNLIGDVGISGSTVTIQPGAVSNSKLATMNNSTVKCNVSGGAASPSDCTVGQVGTLIGALLGLTGDVTATGPGTVAATVAKIQGTAVSGTTGSTNVVFSGSPTIATPTITTSATDPLLIGGTGTTSTLSLQSTSGVGTTGADIIFKTGNNGAKEAMRILNSGNVGIGTTTSTNPLQVAWANSNVYTGASYASPVAILNTDTTDGNAIGMVFQGIDSGSTVVAAGGVQATVTSHTAGAVNSSLAFLTRNAGTFSERMRIDNAGNVGIGTTSPGSLLTVNGAAALGVAGTTKGTLAFNGNTSGTVTVQPAAAAGTWTMTLPTLAGTSGSVLQTDGSGVTSWGLGVSACSALSGTSVDWSLGNCFTKTLSANTTFTFANKTAGQNVVLRITNPSAFTYTFPNTNSAGNSVLWSSSTIPTASTGNKTDIITVFFDGTNMYGNAVQSFGGF